MVGRQAFGQLAQGRRSGAQANDHRPEEQLRSRHPHADRRCEDQSLDASRAATLYRRTAQRNAPGSAAQVYRTLRGLVSFAIKRDYIAGLDPTRGIDNPRPYRPGPVNAANDAELVALFATLERSATWPATKLAIELQLLTGVRPGEARLASWDEIDLEKAAWHIPAERVKSGRMFIVHLSPAALALLDRARALRGLNATSDQRRTTSYSYRVVFQRLLAADSIFTATCCNRPSACRALEKLTFTKIALVVHK
jgi:integrase